MTDTYWTKFEHFKHMAKTHLLTKEQRCTYYDLYNACFSEGGYLPDDDSVLAKATSSTMDEWTALRPVMLRFFAIDQHGWHHVDLLANMRETASKIAARREAGRKGGNAKALSEKANQASNAIPKEKKREESEKKEDKLESLPSRSESLTPREREDISDAPPSVVPDVDAPKAIFRPANPNASIKDLDQPLPQRDVPPPDMYAEARVVMEKVRDIMGDTYHNRGWYKHGPLRKVDEWLKAGSNPDLDIYPAIREKITNLGKLTIEDIYSPGLFDDAINVARESRIERNKPPTTLLLTDGSAVQGEAAGAHRNRISEILSPLRTLPDNWDKMTEDQARAVVQARKSGNGACPDGARAAP